MANAVMEIPTKLAVTWLKGEGGTEELWAVRSGLPSRVQAS